ncbi:MAG: methionine synthase [Chloroflexi bacterium]|nr:methionine synthase [Chloroflexota bacterium]
MAYTDFNCLPTVIGSMPQTDAAEACALVTTYLRDIPAWPQLPKRDYREDMVVQFSEGFPGVVIKDGPIRVERSPNLDKRLEELYVAYLDSNIAKYAVSPPYAAGLYHFLSLAGLRPLAVKGQVTGPITWGLTVKDSDGRSLLYDDVLGDAVAKFLKLKASWQEKELQTLARNTIIFLDEPYMSAFGSVGMSLSREKIISLLEEVFGGIEGIKGVHCCGNTDWSVLLATSTNIISFDTYNYAQSLTLYPEEVKRFLDRKGTIAWGIVPNNDEVLSKETVASLKDRLEEAMAPFTRKGIPFRQLLAQGLLTPSCGLAPLPDGEATERALQMLVDLSAKIRERL